MAMAKKMVRCPQGHLYEADQYSTCPHCPVPDLDVGQPPPTHPGDRQRRMDPGRARPPGGGREDRSPNITEKYYPDRTREPRFDPVVGWLVCVKGKERGKDYRIQAEWNYIGRDTDMQICIQGDDGISRHRHAKLNFDPRSNEFWIAPGEAGKNTYLNGRNVMEASRLKAWDRIELGHTQLLFVPLCGETFTWEVEANAETPPNEIPEPKPGPKPEAPGTWPVGDDTGKSR